ncbi:MAG: hypothetical protein MJY44_02170 [Bacteroidales bacterium]|nr:hypothetical protein [Bacteroidales bacterium]
MKRITIFALIACLCLSCNKSDQGGPQESPVDTGAASRVTSTSASVGGLLKIPAGEPGSFVFGIQYSIDSGMESDVLTAKGKNYNVKDGTFSADLYSLSANQEYWYRAYLSYPNGSTVYGRILSFRTSDVEVSVATAPASDFYTASAQLNGLARIKGAVGGDPVLYFQWGLAADALSNVALASIVSDGVFSANVSSLSSDVTYWYRAVCDFGGSKAYGNILNFIIPDDATEESAVTLYPMMEEAVDLGLPSGTRWCSHNLGAERMTDYGDFYAWAGVTPHYRRDTTTVVIGDSTVNVINYVWKPGKYGYSWETCPYWLRGDNVMTAEFSKYNVDFQYVVLDSGDDAATQNMGGGWRTPTMDEWGELTLNCDWYWASVDGVKGYIVKKRDDYTSNIFLAAGGSRSGVDLRSVGTDGRYWTADLSHENLVYAYGFNFTAKRISEEMYYAYRYEGLAVRPVLPAAD